ncbi:MULTISPECIES: hypothetical protein [Pseudomonas putida group]|nr:MULTISPECIES: hypothetical protein [Pseudomonas putida group]
MRQPLKRSTPCCIRPCSPDGGFVLPRLRLDYSQAEFSVTWMLDYTN